MLSSPGLRWLFGVIVAAAIVGLIAWARNDAGVDDRDPDPPSESSVLSDGTPAPPLDTPVTTAGATDPPTT